MNYICELREKRSRKKMSALKLQNCADLKFANICLKPNANLVRGKLEKKKKSLAEHSAQTSSITV